MEESVQAHESPGCTVGIAIGMLLVLAPILGLVLKAVNPSTGILDAEDYASKVFRSGEAPYGLVLREATVAASREKVVSFGLPEAADVDEGAEARAAPEAVADGEATIEGAAPVALDPRSTPDELIFVEYPSIEAARAAFLTGVEASDEGGGRRRRGRDNSASMEASANLARWKDDPSFGWHTTIEAGPVSWSRWRADFRIERSFREGGGWRDSGRVDLCQEERPLILFALWPVEVEATEESLREVLTHIRML